MLAKPKQSQKSFLNIERELNVKALGVDISGVHSALYNKAWYNVFVSVSKLDLFSFDLRECMK